jgi:hypothetical protein
VAHPLLYGFAMNITTSLQVLDLATLSTVSGGNLQGFDRRQPQQPSNPSGYNVGRTVRSGVGGCLIGGAAGALVGFFTGGPPGAAAGAVAGCVRGAVTGAGTDAARQTGLMP